MAQPRTATLRRGGLIAGFLALLLGGAWATASWVESNHQVAAASAEFSPSPDPLPSSVPATPSPTPTPSASPSPSPSPSRPSPPEVQIQFAVNSSMLTPAAKRALDRVAAYVKSSPTAFVILQGHADSSGSATLNDQLSMSRAHMVEHYLASRGVPRNRLSHTAFGEGNPDPTATSDAANRRVDVIVREG